MYVACNVMHCCVCLRMRRGLRPYYGCEYVPFLFVCAHDFARGFTLRLHVPLYLYLYPIPFFVSTPPPLLLAYDFLKCCS